MNTRIASNPLKTSKVDARESLMAMIAHDLKNPVNSGMMALKLLENKELSPLNPYQKEIIENVETGFLYMKNLIDNILARYKFNNNKYIIDKHPSDIISLIDYVIGETRYLFIDKNQTLNFNSSIENRIINIDPLEIQRVINNLFVNAIKYSPENSVIIFNVSQTRNKMIFSVENPGHGINLENPNDVLEKFVSSNSKSAAAGLGLFIVKEIVKAHGGEVFVESIVEKFTRITFVLPIK